MSDESDNGTGQLYNEQYAQAVQQRHDADEADDSDDEDYVESSSAAESDVSDEGPKNPWVVSQNFTAEVYPRGHRFPGYLTYKELYDTINLKHQMHGGGEPLKTKGLFKNPQDPLPYQISFYCPHGRKHVQVDKSKAPSCANPSAKRAKRDGEDRRTAFTECKYKINVRLDTDYESAGVWHH
jgi:hypothetical protein